mmetsp:Transcript_63845/g.93482  ORF Transcript_63845/g.93482 Transcript_63845/m.93482 type:complete len:218 (-) Transcript_63845:535-1188(-)
MIRFARLSCLVCALTISALGCQRGRSRAVLDLWLLLDKLMQVLCGKLVPISMRLHNFRHDGILHHLEILVCHGCAVLAQMLMPFGMLLPCLLDLPDILEFFKVIVRFTVALVLGPHIHGVLAASKRHVLFDFALLIRGFEIDRLLLLRVLLLLLDSALHLLLGVGVLVPPARVSVLLSPQHFGCQRHPVLVPLPHCSRTSAAASGRIPLVPRRAQRN